MGKKNVDPLKVVNSGFSGTMSLEESKKLLMKLKERAKHERENKS